MNLPLYRFSIIHMGAHAALSKASHAVLDVYGLNSAQWRILGLLSESEKGHRIADLAVITHMQSTQINAMVRDLLQRKLIEKKPHLTDKRANLLRITAEGQHQLGRIEAGMQVQLAHLLRDTSDTDFLKYVKVLEAIKQAGAGPQGETK